MEAKVSRAGRKGLTPVKKSWVPYTRAVGRVRILNGTNGGGQSWGGGEGPILGPLLLKRIQQEGKKHLMCSGWGE